MLSRSFWPNVLFFAYKHAPLRREGDSLPIYSEIKMSGPDRMAATVSSIRLDRGRLVGIRRFTRFPVAANGSPEGGSRVVGPHVFGMRDEKIVKARPMHKYSMSDNAAVIDWLLRFQNRAAHHPVDLDSFMRELVRLRGTAEYRSFGSKLRHDLDGACLSLEEFIGEQGPRAVPEHGDLWLRNVLVSLEGGIEVIDWDFSRDQGNEVFDFLYFTLTNMLSGASPVSEFWNNVRGHGPYSRFAAANCRRFSRATGIPVPQLVQWVPYVLLRVVVRQSPRGDSWSPSYILFRPILEEWTQERVDRLG